jgi:hypothetical protein
MANLKGSPLSAASVSGLGFRCLDSAFVVGFYEYRIYLKMLCRVGAY